MNYGELKTAVASDGQRSDLFNEIPRFIRQAEGRIRRDLKGYILRYTLTDSDRQAPQGGDPSTTFSLPTYLQEIRDLRKQGRQGDSLTRVAPGQIRRLALTADVVQYCQHGDGSVEFRGNPADTDFFDLYYFGTPEPLASDTDTNDLLRDHETLYISGALIYLHRHVQDLELAEVQKNVFNNTVQGLNKLMARKIGGAAVAPTYNFAGGSSY